MAPRAPEKANTSEWPKTPVTGQGQASSGDTGTQTIAVRTEVANETGNAHGGLSHTKAKASARITPSAKAAPIGSW
ncbi:hypothetical protein GCM10009554_15610 [Kribbella koreensis]|uniref:Uncharacterized protein n=1 Tax=Kribbella koreensis TaxID=57909 RepID=A0ABP4A543_9ACTN